MSGARRRVGCARLYSFYTSNYFSLLGPRRKFDPPPALDQRGDFFYFSKYWLSMYICMSAENNICMSVNTG